MPAQKTKYPWKSMKVGDSFFAPIVPANITASKVHAQRSTGYKFALRSENGGVRVWRVK